MMRTLSTNARLQSFPHLLAPILAVLLFLVPFAWAGWGSAEWAGVQCGPFVKKGVDTPCQPIPGRDDGRLYCCSRWGWCGEGPMYCGRGNCVNGPCEGDGNSTATVVVVIVKHKNGTVISTRPMAGEDAKPRDEETSTSTSSSSTSSATTSTSTSEISSSTTSTKSSSTTTSPTPTEKPRRKKSKEEEGAEIVTITSTIRRPSKTPSSMDALPPATIILMPNPTVGPDGEPLSMDPASLLGNNQTDPFGSHAPPAPMPVSATLTWLVGVLSVLMATGMAAAMA